MKYLEGGLIRIHYVNRPKVIVKKKSINSSQELMFYDSLCQGVGKSFDLATLIKIQTGKFFIGIVLHIISMLVFWGLHVGCILEY